jgi:ribosomal protein S18 acetylase RimI-like enzyme
VSVEIRAATKDDAALIAMLNADVQALHADAVPWRFKQPGPETFTPKDAEALLSRANHVAFLAHVDATPAGYVVAHLMRNPETAFHYAHAMIYVHQISVRPDFQRRGVGRALLDAVKAHGAANGISLLALDTWTFNAKALAFFRAYGLVDYNVRLWSRIG